MPPNNCDQCDDGCAQCTNSTRACSGCDSGYWLDNSLNPAYCKLECQKGPFTLPSNPSYLEELGKRFKAWMSPNSCQYCSDGCQLCQNATLNCLDIKLDYNLKQKQEEYAFSEILLTTELKRSGSSFMPPSNFDMSYVLKVLDFKPIKEADDEQPGRVLQTNSGEGDDEEEVVEIPLMKSEYDSATNKINAQFVIPEPWRIYKNFDLKI
jgi:hypothetical protein